MARRHYWKALKRGIIRAWKEWLQILADDRDFMRHAYMRLIYMYFAHRALVEHQAEASVVPYWRQWIDSQKAFRRRVAVGYVAATGLYADNSLPGKRRVYK